MIFGKIFKSPEAGQKKKKKLKSYFSTVFEIHARFSIVTK